MAQAVSESVRTNRAVLRLVQGDITLLDVDAFVFYARPDLALGSGFGSMISIRAGPTVKQELQGLAQPAASEAVVTAAGKLKARYIIHAVGPRFQEEDTEGKLRATVLNSLKRAEEKGIKRLALPAMGAGFYGVPLDLCARVMVEAVQDYLQRETGLEEVVICVLDAREYQPFKAQLASVR
jgi:O-acetyl-ADP-ribose deacetylase (regulator of RNase III)